MGSTPLRIFCVLTVVLNCTWCFGLGKGTAKYPVVLVPGDGGSQFYAKLDKPSTVHSFCSKKTDDYFPLWLNLELLVPYVMDCLVDNMRLVYNARTRTTSNSPGVSIVQPGFGNSSTVEWLDSAQHSATSYFYHIAQALVDAGLERDVSLRGAPYDFRKAPNEMQDFNKNLVTLIEDTYKQNGKRKVVLIGHSMGNPYVLYMLHGQPQQWKDRYIQSFISLAAPWGGAAKTIRVMASGDSLDVFVVNPLSARPEQRSMPSSAWLLPSAEFWRADEILVFGPTRNYTVKDYKEFFDDIKYPTGWLMQQDTQDLLKPRVHPGVTVYCLHGRSVKTPGQFHWSPSKWPDYQPDVIWDDGDGTVNLRSLHGCDLWIGKDQKHPVTRNDWPNVGHLGILKDQDVINYILRVVSS